MKARRNGFSELQSFWIMGIFAILPEVEIRPPMFANLKTEFTRIGWDGGCLGGVGGDGGRDGMGCSRSDESLSLGVST